MNKKLSIAIAGATGLVGNELVALLDTAGLPCDSVTLLASKESVGEVYQAGTVEVEVELLREEALVGKDLVFLALPAELADQYGRCAVAQGARVVDTSSRARVDGVVPLVLFGVNHESLQASDSLVSVPNASAVALGVVLHALRAEAAITRVVLSSYHACVDAGKAGLDELWEQTLGVFNQKESSHEAFQHQIAFNVIPQVDLMLEDGSTKEEQRIANQLRRVLALPELPVSATAVRVPVFHSDSFSVNLQFEREIAVERACELLAAVEGVRVYTDAAEFPMPTDTAGTDEIHVGRIRRDTSATSALNLWVVIDGLRRGVALNSLRVGRYLVERFSA